MGNVSEIKIEKNIDKKDFFVYNYDEMNILLLNNLFHSELF